MKRKKFLKILAASAFMLTGIGVISHASIGETPQDIAYAEDGKTTTFDFDTIVDESTCDGWSISIEDGANSNQYGKYAQKDYHNKVSVTTGYFFTTYITTSKKCVYLTSTSIFDRITSISFSGGSTEKNKVYLKVEVSPDKDFSDSANIQTILDNKFYNIGAKDNGKVQSCTVISKSTKSYSGYLRFGFYATSTGKSTWMDDLKITTTPESHTVSYYDSDATLLSSELVEEGAYPTGYTPETKTGYTFKGWSTTQGGTERVDPTSIAMSTSDVSYYAVWEEVSTYTVTFNYNDGTTTSTTQTVNSGSTVSEPEEPIRDGYVFTGWYSDSSCTTEFYFTTTITSDMTLYAGWNESVYADTIKIDSDNFTWEDPNTSKQLTATYSNSEGKTINVDTDITWSSDNESVITVDSNGNLTAVDKGEANITATIYKGTTYEETSSILITIDKTLIKGTSKTFTFSSSTLSVTPEVTDFFGDGVMIYHSYYDKGKTKEITFNGNSLQYYRQDKFAKDSSNNVTSGLEINLARTATISLYFTATGSNKTGRYSGIYKLNDNTLVGSTILCETQTAHILKITLDAGNYYLGNYDSNDAAQAVNFYGAAITYSDVFVDASVGLAYQTGKSDATLTYNDCIRFIGILDESQLAYFSSCWFEVSVEGTINGTEFSKSVNTTKETMVYKSIEYYGADGTVKTFGEEGKYYFVASLVNIPETFKGTVTFTSYIADSNGNTYSSSSSGTITID